MLSEWVILPAAMAVTTLVFSAAEIMVKSKSFWHMFSSTAFGRFAFLSFILNLFTLGLLKLSIFNQAGIEESILISYVGSRAFLQEISLNWRYQGLSVNFKKMQEDSIAEAIEEVSQNRALVEERKKRILIGSIADLTKGHQKWLVEQYLFYVAGNAVKEKTDLPRLKEALDNDDDMLRLLLAKKITRKDLGFAKKVRRGAKKLPKVNN